MLIKPEIHPKDIFYISKFNFLSISTMQNSPYTLPALPAGSDPISFQLYNQDNIDKDVKCLLANYLTSQLQKQSKGKILILGGRCGMIAQIFLQFSRQIDIVEEDIYLGVLEERFLKRRDVDYFFGREGFIGNRHICQAPQITDQQVRIIKAQNLKKQAQKHYDIILVQNNIITKSSNLIEQLVGISHQHLITMMIPGKITDSRVFEFFALFERNIISKFYENIFYERLQNKRFITGRREEIVYYQIFIWNRNSEAINEEIIKNLLKVEGQVNENKVDNPYETKQMVEMYVKFHYGEDHFGIQNFPLKCAKICIEQAKRHNKNGRVLDLGCAVGRSTIELAQYFEESIGLDYSAAFIASANQALKEEKYANVQNKVKFVVGDACNLDVSLGKFDLIFGGNLIDRLPDPAAFLKSVSHFLLPNGILILTSPYSWLEQYTNPTKWVGGIIENGTNIGTKDGLQRILVQQGVKPLRDSEDIRFTIKVNDWVYEYTLANATYWIKQS